MSIQHLEDGLIVLGGTLVVETVVRLVGMIGLGLDTVTVLVKIVAPVIYLPFLSASCVREYQVFGFRFKEIFAVTVRLHRLASATDEIDAVLVEVDPLFCCPWGLVVAQVVYSNMQIVRHILFVVGCRFLFGLCVEGADMFQSLSLRCSRFLWFV